MTHEQSKTYEQFKLFAALALRILFLAAAAPLAIEFFSALP